MRIPQHGGILGVHTEVGEVVHPRKDAHFGKLAYPSDENEFEVGAEILGAKVLCAKLGVLWHFLLDVRLPNVNIFAFRSSKKPCHGVSFKRQACKGNFLVLKFKVWSMIQSKIIYIWLS